MASGSQARMHELLTARLAVGRFAVKIALGWKHQPRVEILHTLAVLNRFDP